MKKLITKLASVFTAAAVVLGSAGGTTTILAGEKEGFTLKKAQQMAVPGEGTTGTEESGAPDEIQNYIDQSMEALDILLEEKLGGTESSLVNSEKGMQINKSELDVEIGEGYQLKVRGAKKKVKWTSSVKTVATVSKKGYVIGLSKGTAIITAKSGKKEVFCVVNVTDPNEGGGDDDGGEEVITKDDFTKVKDYLISHGEYDYSQELGASYDLYTSITTSNGTTYGFFLSYYEKFDDLDLVALSDTTYCSITNKQNSDSAEVYFSVTMSDGTEIDAKTSFSKARFASGTIVNFTTGYGSEIDNLFSELASTSMEITLVGTDELLNKAGSSIQGIGFTSFRY